MSQINLVMLILTTAALMYLVAFGLFIMMNIMGVVNLAHGAFLTVGGYTVVVVIGVDVPFWFALPIALLVGSLVGFLVERFLIVPLYRRPLDTILATWGLGIVITQLVMMQFGTMGQLVPVPFAEQPIVIFGTSVAAYRMLLVVVAFVLILGVVLFTRHSSGGVISRAVIMNPDLARALGVNTGRVNALTFIVGSAIAAGVGAAIAPLGSVDPNLGFPWLITSFMVVLLAGSSFGGLVVASIVIATLVSLADLYVGPIVGGLVLVIIPVVMLRFLPGGITELLSKFQLRSSRLVRTK